MMSDITDTIGGSGYQLTGRQLTELPGLGGLVVS